MAVCPQAPVVETVQASSEETERSQARFPTYRALYDDLKDRFPSLHDA